MLLVAINRITIQPKASNAAYLTRGLFFVQKSTIGTTNSSITPIVPIEVSHQGAHLCSKAYQQAAIQCVHHYLPFTFTFSLFKSLPSGYSMFLSLPYFHFLFRRGCFLYLLFLSIQIASFLSTFTFCSNSYYILYSLSFLYALSFSIQCNGHDA